MQTTEGAPVGESTDFGAAGEVAATPAVPAVPATRGVRVSVVIPTLDEAANIPHVFARLPDGIFEVVLVDGHSSDDTVAIAQAILPSVRIVMEPRRGKGAALVAGFRAARGDIVVMLDADGSTDPAEIPRFVDALLAGADFAKGSRFGAGGDSADITPMRRYGNLVLGGAVNVLFGTSYTDLCYGYNAFWKHCLPVMAVDCDGFEVETLINIRIARAGLRVAEVPSFEYERLHGDSKLRAGRDGWRVLRTIMRERLRGDARPDPLAVAAMEGLSASLRRWGSEAEGSVEGHSTHLPSGRTTGTAPLSDETWERIEPLLPPSANKRRSGFGRTPDRRAMDGILLVLRTGCEWRALDGAGICSRSFAARRFQKWQRAGVFKTLWEQGLNDYYAEVGLSWTRPAIVDEPLRIAVNERDLRDHGRHTDLPPAIGAVRQALGPTTHLETNTSTP